MTELSGWQLFKRKMVELKLLGGLGLFAIKCTLHGDRVEDNFYPWLSRIPTVRPYAVVKENGEDYSDSNFIVGIIRMFLDPSCPLSQESSLSGTSQKHDWKSNRYFITVGEQHIAPRHFAAAYTNYHLPRGMAKGLSDQYLAGQSVSLPCPTVAYEFSADVQKGYTKQVESAQAGYIRVTFINDIIDDYDHLKKGKHIEHISFVPTQRRYTWYFEGRRDPKLHKDELSSIIEGFFKVRQSPGLVDQFLSVVDPHHDLKDEEKHLLSSELNSHMSRLDLSKLDDIVISQAGFTCRSGFAFKDMFIKLDKASRLFHEMEFYSVDAGEFNDFRPKMLPQGFVADKENDIAIIALDNAMAYDPGIRKLNGSYGHLLRSAGIAQGFDEFGIEANLFLMGLFHKELKEKRHEFGTVIYKGVHGLPHYYESAEPSVSSSGSGFQRFLETEIDTKKVKSPVKAYLAKQDASGDCIIHGDWKPENMVNGHMVDYAMVGRGFEVDELAYYLSDARFNIGLDAYHHNIDRYIRFRCLHDPDFAERAHEGYGKEMHRLADSAFLSQLVLRHSVMNKRDMNDDSKFAQRRYYQNRIDQVLREGRFV